MPDADRAHRGPARLEVHVGLIRGLLNAVIVINVDALAFLGGRRSVAAIVGAHHANAGIVELERSDPVRRRPGRIPEAHTLAERTARTRELENAGFGRPKGAVRTRPPCDRKALTAAVGSGVTDVLP